MSCQVREFGRSGEPPVSGFLHTPSIPSRDCLILTHGAGANCRSPLLAALGEAFCAAGLAVLRCDLPFRQVRPHGPPPRGSASRDQQGLLAAVEAIRPEFHGRVFLGGHSYGGRQCTMLAAANPTVADGLLLLSYPLHPPGKPEQRRTEHLPDLRIPSLFVHGERDTMGTTEEVREALDLVPAATLFAEIEHAGHELASAKKLPEVAQRIVVAFSDFFKSEKAIDQQAV